MKPIPTWREQCDEATSLGAQLVLMQAEIDALRTLITKLHAAKGRHHTQLAACELFDAVGLKNERPVK